MRENINHYGAVRMRVVGDGNLKMSFHSQDDVISEDLVPFSLTATNRLEPTRLANFVNQRAYLRVEVTDKDEWFSINRIIVFTKTIYQTVPE